jgi:hypothetical protein
LIEPKTMKTVLHSFAYSLEYLRDLVADVPPEKLVAQPPGVANHPAWTIGHLTLSCQMLGGTIDVAPWLPATWATRYGPGSVPAADVDAYESKDELLTGLRDAEARLIGAVERLDRPRLERPFPDPEYRHVFPTIAHALTQVLAGHTAYHVGQVAAWRRAMSLPPPPRAYE